MQRTQFDALKNIGNISLNLSFLFMFILLIIGFVEREAFELNLSMLYLSIFSLISINFISFLINSTMDNLNFIKLIFFFLFILGSIRIKWTFRHLRLLAYILGVFFIFIFIHWIQLDFPSHRYKSIFQNPNYLAVLLFVMIYFKVLVAKFGSKFDSVFFTLLIISNLILIYNTNSRSILLAIGAILISWFILEKHSNLFPYLFPVTILSNLVFLLIYIRLPNTKIGLFLNGKSIELFGKSFFSGRQELWGDILYKIKEKAIWGYGVGTRAGDITQYKLSAHNQYLQLIIEIGLIGFIIFIVLLLNIWILLNKQINNFASKLSACFLIGILVYESFELTLFQNNYSIGIFMWLIITIGINFKER